MCPRRLQPGRRYRAAIVPAFAIGRDAALGRPLDAHADLQPAWRDGEPAELPLYHTWTFSTSPEAGDFEALCKRLEPDTEGGRIGLHEAVVDGFPLLPPFKGRVRGSRARWPTPTRPPTSSAPPRRAGSRGV